MNSAKLNGRVVNLFQLFQQWEQMKPYEVRYIKQSGGQVFNTSQRGVAGGKKHFKLALKSWEER